MKRGYLASVVGALLGAAALGLTGVFVALVLAGNATQDNDGDAFGELFGDLLGIVVVGILLAMAGLWIGAALGCWLGLKVAGHPRQARTGVVLGVLLPPWVIGLAVALGAAFGEVPDLVVGAASAATVVGAPVAARSLAMRGSEVS